MIWVYAVSLSCTDGSCMIAYTLFVNVESYALSVAGGPYVREKCLNNFLLMLNIFTAQMDTCIFMPLYFKVLSPLSL